MSFREQINESTACTTYSLKLLPILFHVSRVQSFHISPMNAMVEDIYLNNGVLELCRSLTIPRHRPDKAVFDFTPDTFTTLISHK
jgi:hypothetical protein